MVHCPIAKGEGLKYKLENTWRGAHIKVNKIDPVTYRVQKELGISIRVFPVHVQRMKKHIEYSK